MENEPLAKPRARSTRGFTPEALATARARYEETDEPQASIALDLGIDRRTLDWVAKKHGWNLRKDRPPRDLSPAAKLDQQAAAVLAGPANSEAATTGSDGVASAAPVSASVPERLEAAVEKELRKVESLRGELGRPAQRTIQSERIARTLATLTETLFKVRRLREPGNISGSNDDDLPSDADGFRRMLAHRIEVFVRSRTDGSVSEGDQPGDAEPAAS
jgi:hypothetical protein